MTNVFSFLSKEKKGQLNWHIGIQYIKLQKKYQILLLKQMTSEKMLT